jgi:hypothetical protein
MDRRHLLNQRQEHVDRQLASTAYAECRVGLDDHPAPYSGTKRRFLSRHSDAGGVESRWAACLDTQAQVILVVIAVLGELSGAAVGHPVNPCWWLKWMLFESEGSVTW